MHVELRRAGSVHACMYACSAAHACHDDDPLFVHLSAHFKHEQVSLSIALLECLLIGTVRCRGQAQAEG